MWIYLFLKNRTLLLSLCFCFRELVKKTNTLLKKSQSHITTHTYWGHGQIFGNQNKSWLDELTMNIEHIDPTRPTKSVPEPKMRPSGQLHGRWPRSSTNSNQSPITLSEISGEWEWPSCEGANGNIAWLQHGTPNCGRCRPAGWWTREVKSVHERILQSTQKFHIF